ncbi:MAG TPA: helix-hairpin-helix domain-containing protein [Alphaproteobacteria bacterium]|nr:helix-hairpin-helix domain-containing protein [Alphaproteobacteria bacterium]
MHTIADLNHCGFRQLVEVEGIDDDLAEVILAWREENGPFDTVADLDRVPRFYNLPEEHKSMIRAQLSAEPTEIDEISKRHRPPLNINTATREELMTIRGIGEERADAIIDYRETNLGFGSVDELDSIEVFAEERQEERNHIKGYLSV